MAIFSSLTGQAPLEAARAISEQLVARVKASLERRASKEAEFEGEGAWDEEDNDLLEEQIAPEEVCMPCCDVQYLRSVVIAAQGR